MSDAEAFAERLRAAWSSPTLDEALAEARGAFHPDAVFTQPLVRTRRGFDSFERNMRALAEIYDDLRLRVVDWGAVGDVVWVTFELTGAVGRRRLRTQAVDRFVLAGGRARERRATLAAWALVRPVLATPRAWPRALRAYLRLVA